MFRDLPKFDEEFLAQLPPEQREAWAPIVEGQQRKRREIERCFQAREFDRVLMLSESHERAERLVAWDEQKPLTATECRTLLEGWWSSTEAWGGDSRLREGMIRILRRAGFIETGSTLPAFDYLNVYRGNLGEHPGKSHSWSLSRASATRFALMASGPRGLFLGMSRTDGGTPTPTVWGAGVVRAGVLGYFDDRGEEEVVVDPDFLVDIFLYSEPGGKISMDAG